MIGTLKGVIEYREDPFLIIDINGVGYKVVVPTSVLSKIQGTGEKIKLYTHTHVREDLLELYGFTDPSDLKVFLLLISVSGIGCRTALGIFSVGSRQDIVQAISNGDVSFFTSVPRLGKKNGQKIIIELKSKLGANGDLDLSDDGGAGQEELLNALKAFGYSVHEAHDAIRGLDGKGETLEEKVRLALKHLGR
ncbi:MAG TPA: Holliday junction branch migration protein RuvA [Candidatus Sulfotelmatobacter sp.]|jgi:Holliday junction DNA helicase RuvA|nr:Holliday junction branch migration protein RuvA [Candidatus Sulfotelmatobacter sp.]